MPQIDTEAVILKSVDSGETSRRLTFFTRDEGRLSLTIKGARGKGGRAHAAFEPFKIARVAASLRDDADLGTLSRGEIVRSFPAIHSELERLAVAGVFCEALDRASPPRLANERLYRYAVAFLEALETEPVDRLLSLALHGLTRLIQAAGVAPTLDRCVACGRAPEPGMRLGFEAGGLVCGGCREGADVGLTGEISTAAIDALSRRARAAWAEIRETGERNDVIWQALSCLDRWFSYQFETDLRSVRFLRSSLAPAAPARRSNS